MSWTRIRLELARGPHHPEGSHRIGYELTLPLETNGRLAVSVFRELPELCTIHRQREDSDERVGTLKHHRGDHWVFAYGAPNALEENLPRFGQHRFQVGDYISVLDDHGHDHTYRIVSSVPAPGLAHARMGASS
jgi:hypothetical protein